MNCRLLLIIGLSIGAATHAGADHSFGIDEPCSAVFHSFRTISIAQQIQEIQRSGFTGTVYSLRGGRTTILVVDTRTTNSQVRNRLSQLAKTGLQVRRLSDELQSTVAARYCLPGLCLATFGLSSNLVWMGANATGDSITYWLGAGIATLASAIMGRVWDNRLSYILVFASNDEDLADVGIELLSSGANP